MKREKLVIFQKLHFRTYLAVLVTFVLCIIFLMHFQYLNESANPESSEYGSNYCVILNGSGSYQQGEGQTNLTHSDPNMGDERRNSSSSEKSKSSSSGGSKSGSTPAKNDPYQGHFDIVQLSKHLNLCVREKDHEIDMDEYIQVFQQLYKFFFMLGTVFGFVGSDVKAKLEILHGYRIGENKSHYETVEKMLEFEKSTNFIDTNKESSGSRTFLRLHRALNFVSKFLGKVDTIKDSEGTAHVCKEAYTATLAQYHAWLIQKGAILAMYALPTKKDLISRVSKNSVCDSHIEDSQVRRLLHEVIASTQKVFDQCETAYRDTDLLNLP